MKPARLGCDLFELEERARAVMEAGAFDYVAGGAEDEVTLRDNVDAWTRRRLRPRVLRDVSRISTATTVLGTGVSVPILVAPVAYQRLAHPEGEQATAVGTVEAGSLMVLSTRSSCAIEEVAAAIGAGSQDRAPAAGVVPGPPLWFQVYVLADRAVTADLVDRAVAAGSKALVLTVDTPRLGYRRRDARNGFLVPRGDRGVVQEAYFGAEQSPAVVPADVAWLAERSGLPVVAKGVLSGEAARSCVNAGAAAVVVSNHGGRQLDGSVATADALAEVVETVGAEAEVYVDGGIRRGSDVLKALALGARAVLVGRPVIWGLATGGASGVAGVLGHLAFELDLAMALAGVPTLADIDAGLLAPSGPADLGSGSARDRP